MELIYVETSYFPTYLEKLKERHGSYYQMAEYYDINSAFISHALHGNVYPKLLKALGVSLTKQRPRLTIDCDAATVTRYDKLRGEHSRREFMKRLLDRWYGFEEMEI